MPDWRTMVNARLGELGLDATRRNEIFAELADHLEDAYGHLRQRGVTAERAVQETLAEVPDWTELQSAIRAAEREEEAMNHRTKCLWLPGLVTMTLSMGLLRAIQLPWFQAGGTQPRFLYMDRLSYVTVYWPWLLALPVIGALGAYWSRRAGGKLIERVLASLDRHVSSIHKLMGMAGGLLGWVAIPGLCLVLGAAPFLRAVKEPSRDAVNAAT